MVEDGQSFQEEKERENAIEVLIHIITMHFVSNLIEELQISKLDLTNLRYPTLGDFRWYKDMFNTHIF